MGSAYIVASAEIARLIDEMQKGKDGSDGVESWPVNPKPVTVCMQENRLEDIL